MNIPIMKFISILLAVFLISSLVFADDKGKGKNKAQPPGWKQGEKTGWGAEETPPGLSEEKLDKKQKTKVEGGQKKGKAKREAKKTKDEAKLKKAKHESEMEQKKEKSETDIEEEMDKEKKKMKAESKQNEG